MFVGLFVAFIGSIRILTRIIFWIFTSRRKFNMKKAILELIAGLLVASIGIYYSFFDMQHLPTGELIKEVSSPNGEYIFKAYLCNGGATVDFAIRGEVEFTKQYGKVKTIYWNYHQDHADLKWMDNQTIIINGHTLDVLRDSYDWRRE